MHLPTLLSLLPLLISTTLAHPLQTSQQAALAFEASIDASTRIPTPHESAVLARRLLALSSLGVLSTIFPAHPSALENRPVSVAQTPIGLPDYFADCESAGDPTILSLDVSTSTKNAVAGSNVSLAVSWWDHVPATWSYASLPRLSVVGHIEDMTDKEVGDVGVEECFLQQHGDARLWLPGSESSPHTGRWTRLRVEEVYWVGGFGDVAYIGWLNPEDFKNVTKEEWSKVRLPGEK